MREVQHISKIIRRWASMPVSTQAELTDRVKRSLRNDFDNSTDFFTDRAIISEAEDLGFYDLAAEMRNDLQVSIANNRAKEDAIKETYPAKERMV